ncbi:hypothetical protein K431DRAFT_330629 [Polychaeton citri CBS 116435]|uniref:Uncharacterized protein n=1 Tax=Polychaeton citri CBS 116435 TaxID=1314669 RepID=A0A9P4ULA1_9PEZI|nr:hypothetical protein K431DRAFT_330629 [Polychaeton citri CBS 116435]
MLGCCILTGSYWFCAEHALQTSYYIVHHALSTSRTSSNLMDLTQIISVDGTPSHSRASKFQARTAATASSHMCIHNGYGVYSTAWPKWRNSNQGQLVRYGIASFAPRAFAIVIHPQHKMEEDGRAGIRNALQHYRETVDEHNVFVLRILVEVEEARPIHPRLSEKSAMMYRLETFETHLGVDVKHFASRPQDLVSDDVFATIVTHYGLDNFSSTAQRRNTTTDPFPPAESQYLSTLVGGNYASGLRRHYKPDQLDLLESLTFGEDLEETRGRVYISNTNSRPYEKAHQQALTNGEIANTEQAALVEPP